MRGPSQDLSVYDFDEEEEAVEAASGKLMRRFVSKLPTKTDDAINKYAFLQAFTSGMHNERKDVTDIMCMDLQERDNAGASFAIDTPERNPASTEEISGMDAIVASSSSHGNHNHACVDEYERGSLLGADSLVVRDSLAEISAGSKLLVERKPVDVTSDEDESWTSSRSPSTPSSDLEENRGDLNCFASYSCCPTFEDNENVESAVTVFADYVVYENMPYGESQITFFSDCIKVECYDARASDEKIVLKWEITDVIHITCQWSGSVDAALIKFQLGATVPDTEKMLVASDVKKLTIAVIDSYWPDKEQKIMSLSASYQDVWNALPGDGLAWDDEAIGRNMCLSKDYFEEIAEPFEDVVYPKGDPDAVSISKRDIELLQPDTFINDTIIDFYIKYLKNNIEPTEKHRFHFFNSFFFRKLADLDKNPGCNSEGKAAFLRVRKWTRKVNIFEKDYIFIPVNFNLHWSLLVICHPGEVANLKDVDSKESSKIPCILHMDSIKGSHSGLKNIIQSYLCEEWKEKHPESSEDDASKLSNLRFVSLEQENSFDCGLFLLHYVELFLKEAPVDFSPFKMIKKHSNFLLNVDWFLPAEASLKRSFIRKLIYELLKESSHKEAPGACGSNCPPVEIKENGIDQEPVEFISEQCKSAHTGRVAAFSVECSEHAPELTVTLQKSECTISPIEENVNVNIQSVSQVMGMDFSRPNGEDLATQICTTSYSMRDVEVYEASWSSMRERNEPIQEHNVPSDQKVVEDLGHSTPENDSYVPDSHTSTSSDKPESSVEDSQCINGSVADEGESNCEGSEEAEITGNDDQSHEDQQGVDTETAGRSCDGSESDGSKGNETENTEEEDENAENCPEVNTTITESGGCDGPPPTHQDNLIVSSSCQYIEVPGDDSSQDEDGTAAIKKRDEPGTGADQQPSKRQKVSHPAGRRRTRSFTRDCQP
ncbi:putative Ulp1 peptidase [Dioscorea sansibarensis]